MRSSYWLALVLAVLAGGWILSGQLGERAPAAQADASVEPAEPTRAPPAVRVRDATARVLMTEIVVRGQTEAVRTVTVRAETFGRVVDVRIEEGARVKAGDVIVRLSLKAREARLQEERALAEQRRIEYEAAVKLAEKGSGPRPRWPKPRPCSMPRPRPCAPWRSRSRTP